MKSEPGGTVRPGEQKNGGSARAAPENLLKKRKDAQWKMLRAFFVGKWREKRSFEKIDADERF